MGRSLAFKGGKRAFAANVKTTELCWAKPDLHYLSCLKRVRPTTIDQSGDCGADPRLVSAHK